MGLSTSYRNELVSPRSLPESDKKKAPFGNSAGNTFDHSQLEQLLLLGCGPLVGALGFVQLFPYSLLLDVGGCDKSYP